MPFAIINDITGKWPLGGKACKIWIRLALDTKADNMAGLFLMPFSTFNFE